MRFFTQIIARLRGEQLGVLGERGVGKTHLQTFLRDGKIPTVYVQTMQEPKLAAAGAQLWSVTGSGSGQLRVLLKPGRDVPGTREAVEAWRSVVHRATILLYLFRADLLYREDTAHQRRVQEDAELIGGLLARRPSGTRPPRVAMVGTHYDKVLGYASPREGSAFYRWHLRTEENPVVGEARLQLGKALRDRPALVVGSMCTLDDTQELAYRLFSQELAI